MVFTVNVIHGKQRRGYKCSTKRDFLTKILQNYGIIKDELLLIDTLSQKEILLDDIEDGITVEVKTRLVANGQRSDSVVETAPAGIKDSDIISKLTENRVLTGLERKWLIKLVIDKRTENVIPNNKRGRDDEHVQTANKKLQVEIDDLKPIKTTSCTQTDTVKTDRVDRNQPSRSSNFIHESKLLARKEKRDPKRVVELMTSTYNDRRNFILMQNPVVSLVKEKYPLLFTLSEVRNELNRIFYDGKDAEVLSNIRKYSRTILSLVDDGDPLLNLVNKKIEESATENKKQYAREVGALLILSNVIKERRSYLSTEDEPCERNTYPRIEAPCRVNELFTEDHIFRIVVENLLFCEAYDFCEAVLCLLASFFIFNISYPDKVFNTLVVMERVFLEANDTDGNDIDDSTLQVVKLIQLKTLVKSKATSNKQ